jgi:hypothetical protein
MSSKKSESLIAAWKKRKDYLGDKKNTSMYNTHRGICYTQKGKDIGYPENWQLYSDFIKNIPDGFQEGYLLLRHDKTKPYSKENCFWGEKGVENISKLSVLKHNNEEKTLVEWCEQYNLNYNGVRQRFHKGKNYTSDEILFGKALNKRKEITDIRELSIQKARDKVSKMLSSYKNKDLKKGMVFNLSKEYFLNQILLQPCIYCGDTEKIGADRIDNNKGHEESNVVPCCVSCNTTRNCNYSHEEMLLLGKTIRVIKNKRNENN